MHRMFLACPIPSEPAERLAAWASGVFSGLPARVLDPRDLHATLFFYPSVDDGTRANLASWTSGVAWDPIRVRVGDSMPTRTNAAAWRLEGDETALKRLHQRMVGGRDDPLWRLCCAQSEPDLERVRRRIPRGRPPNLHVTLARMGGRATPPKLPGPPALEFTLDRVALYESLLGPGSSRYAIVAESPS